MINLKPKWVCILEEKKEKEREIEIENDIKQLVKGRARDRQKGEKEKK